MRISFSRSFILYILIIFANISRIKSKIDFRDENNFGLNKEDYIIYRVSRSIAHIAESLNDKISIIKKWYHLIHGDSDILSRSRDQHSFLFQQGQMIEEKNRREDEEDHYPREIKIQKAQEQGYPLVDTDDTELDIHQYHYSYPSYIVSNNNVRESFSSYYDPIMEGNQFRKRLIKRGPPTCTNDKWNYCPNLCDYYNGGQLVIKESYAPMYNCSGRFLTNVYDKGKLPLNECSSCSPKNVTCLGWCCQLMDTTVNKNIPENITRENKVDGVLTNVTVPNPNLKKVCYCPIDRYGANCNYFYNVKCNLTLISPNTDCYSKDGEKLKGLKYYDKENQCPLYNYTDVIKMTYSLECHQVLDKKFNLSLATNNYTFYNSYIVNKLPLYISKIFNPVTFVVRLWNFNHLGFSNDISFPLNESQLLGNEPIEVEIDLGRYYLPDDKMRSIYNGGRVAVDAGFEYNYFLSGSFPKHVITYINIGNYFKNTDFFEKEVILKTIKQILTIVIPIVVGSILLVALLVFIVYVLYKKSRAMKVSC